MTVFSLAFWRKTAEAMIVTFGTVMAGSGVFTGGAPDLHSVYASLISAGIAALYVLAKAIGGSEVITTTGAKHANQDVQNQF